VKLTTRLHLVPRLRNRGDTPLNTCVFMACCLIKHRDKIIYIIYSTWLEAWPITSHSPAQKKQKKNMDICVHQTAFEPVIAILSLYVYDCTVLLLDLGRSFTFLILYTVGRTPWTGDQPVARPLRTERHKHRINAHSHPCLDWDWNLRSQCSSG
jgi:hypothetical protein